MRAVVCRSFSGIDDLDLGEIAAPKPGAGEILVQVHAAAVNFMDCLMVAGKYQLRPQTPFVPGTDATGIVAAVGEGVTRFKPGDRVACSNWTGAYAPQTVASQLSAAHLPSVVDFATAAVVRHCYGTAYYAFVERAKLQPGETVFVSGAAGGVGLAAVDLARSLGARVVAGVGSEAKAKIVREYGADEVIDYVHEDLRERIKAVTGGKGVDVVFDVVGGDVFNTMTRLMNWGGRMLPIGFASGDIPSVPMNLPLLKNYSIVGVFWGAWAERYREASIAADEQLFEWIAQGKLKPHVGGVFPLEQFKEAMESVLDRTAQGRVVLNVADSA
ncbi:MAG TPA: NADPH:quinone oxidoreductase family protein [Verrucomicrobiae bacterium]|nr:NADPH:quinone oxidoreductase family protein [Verrucomicrobiae bacterium]